MLMFITTTWAEQHFLPTVFCYAMFAGGFGQFFAGILELIKGNTFGGTAFSSYGAFWMGWFLIEYLTTTRPDIFLPARTGKTLLCGMWGFLALGFSVVTLRKNVCLVTTFCSLALTFWLLAGGVWNARCNQAAGYIGFFCGSSAIYTAFAFLYDAETGHKLPGVRPVNFLPCCAEHPNAVVRPAAAAVAGGSAVVTVVGGVEKVGQGRAAAAATAGVMRAGSGRSGNGSKGVTGRGGSRGDGTAAAAACRALGSETPNEPVLPGVV
ncbi:hypothetical protein PLESTB_000373600 [Pleodorina starrii]|uniref:Uncharacterized protein n=1 Tax=Pleodorina starrii TaxID=330485 RepID=A0A9W6BE62_9CHLO|nr:hypothetical protein PLESTB_000373600 [Pleodorina starrii]